MFNTIAVCQQAWKTKFSILSFKTAFSVYTSPFLYTHFQCFMKPCFKFSSHSSEQLLFSNCTAIRHCKWQIASLKSFILFYFSLTQSSKQRRQNHAQWVLHSQPCWRSGRRRMVSFLHFTARKPSNWVTGKETELLTVTWQLCKVHLSPAPGDSHNFLLTCSN